MDQERIEQLAALVIADVICIGELAEELREPVGITSSRIENNTHPENAPDIEQEPCGGEW